MELQISSVDITDNSLIVFSDVASVQFGITDIDNETVRCFQIVFKSGRKSDFYSCDKWSIDYFTSVPRGTQKS